jgi:hypothetical protein
MVKHFAGGGVTAAGRNGIATGSRFKAGQDGMTLERKHTKTRPTGEFSINSRGDSYFLAGVSDGITTHTA